MFESSVSVGVLDTCKSFLFIRLDEYLTHLDRTGFSFDGGPSLDFAEAALLIQSSACVYSKKVEYLHNLVYQVFVVNPTRG